MIGPTLISRLYLEIKEARAWANRLMRQNSLGKGKAIGHLEYLEKRMNRLIHERNDYMNEYLILKLKDTNDETSNTY